MADDKLTSFVLAHENDDTGRLLLAADRWPDVDVRRAVRNIEMREKVPAWYACTAVDYPDSLPLEQCSSEKTARYKQAFVPACGRIADLTGGLGVDCWAMARLASEAHYCERNATLCGLARHNFAALGAGNITVHEGDGIGWLQAQPGRFDLIYLDPARRSRTSGRVYDIAGCEPNLLEIKDMLLSRADRVLAKISPMADISRTLAQLPETRELHVVEAGGEVKELLVLLEPGTGQARICAWSGGETFSFLPEEEASASYTCAGHVGRYLFQPAKALRKAGAFRLLSSRFSVAKLAPSTHLYTADEPVAGFPGKCFEVEEVIAWSRFAQRDLRRRYDRLELTALNFPMTTDGLRRKLDIPDGGGHHLFATSLNNEKLLIICKI